VTMFDKSLYMIKFSGVRQLNN